MKRHRKYCAVGKLIRVRLAELGTNQEWLADQMNMSTMSISHIVTGKSIPSVQTVYKLAQALDQDIDKIITAIASEEKENVS